MIIGLYWNLTCIYLDTQLTTILRQRNKYYIILLVVTVQVLITINQVGISLRQGRETCPHVS